ncbi:MULTISPECIES: DUF58 domain-containing protein [unclassified Treponema]|uniref:DUF58 domain-containing protein n=1 Tax=unclassified Treponema TaxID=2638727 RepID=UPI0020A552F8|nr:MULTISPECIES: DUF58 domain-containing protein [unclassified Treponema]UTC66557.1 DUF58 domain-containing protein [Treponema sp. OMZ 789]UTC69289.1 DUF58 domain-containing protein [Treponema sp. OMZ 790]UTC72003.1 DUF58 domain-containing protein [Treponema sp. OMZ 791]
MKTFSLTVSGIIYIVFSILLLIGAVIRGELFAIVCGVSLCLYFLLSLILIIISFFLWKKTDSLIELRNNSIYVFPLGVRKEKKLFPVILPGVIVFYIFEFLSDLTDKKSRKLKFNIKLKRDINRFVFPKRERGRFFCKKEYIEISDLAGFFSIKLLKKEKSLTKIFIDPVLTEVKDFSLPEILNEISEHMINTRRTDELYDTRPYFPGDDTRKINWKLYAHTEELNIRQGDFIPPPRTFLTIYVESPIVNKNIEFYKNKFDEFINLSASAAFYLHRNGISFNICLFDCEKNSYEIFPVYADKSDAEESIKNIFSIPQIKIIKKTDQLKYKIKKNFLIDTENKKTCLLYFFMPVYPSQEIFEEFFAAFTEYKNKCAFYIGLENIINKPKNILNSFLFYTFAEKKEHRLAAGMNANIEALKDELKEGGFCAFSI